MKLSVNASERGKALVAIVDDDASVRRALRRLIRASGYRVEVFEEGRSFLESEVLERVACVVLDIRMPGIDGLQVQMRLNRTKHVPIIFISGHDDAELREAALAGGGRAFFHKPFDEKALLEEIKAATRAESDPG